MLKILRSQAANLFTLINMILGLAAILQSIDNNYVSSSLLIVIAALTDRLDGLIARRLKTESLIGKYFDSNSDLVSFGIAPGLLIYLTVMNQFGVWGIVVSFLFIIGGAYRLARYNANEFTGIYKGLPITIAGAILALSVFAISYIPSYFYIVISLLLTYLMVSNHSIKKR